MTELLSHFDSGTADFVEVTSCYVTACWTEPVLSCCFLDCVMTTFGQVQSGRMGASTLQKINLLSATLRNISAFSATIQVRQILTQARKLIKIQQNMETLQE